MSRREKNSRKDSIIKKKFKNLTDSSRVLPAISLNLTVNNNDNFLNTKRINTINCVFETLRNRIPTFPYERRLSKIDTLHLTISYIHLLQSIINSNLNLFDYLCKTLNDLISYNNSANNGRIEKPKWATSDLIVRLNWLNWNEFGIDQNETSIYLNLFNQIYELAAQL